MTRGRSVQTRPPRAAQRCASTANIIPACARAPPPGGQAARPATKASWRAAQRARPPARYVLARAAAPEATLAAALAALAAGDEAALLLLLTPQSDDAAVWTDSGAFAAAAHALDVGARRVLPWHASATVLALLQGAAARVAATSASGEAGVFAFALERHVSQWRVAAVTRDDASDQDAAQALLLPNAATAPEVVARAFLARLAGGGVAFAGALASSRGIEHPNVSRAGRSTNGGPAQSRGGAGRFAALLRSPAYALLVRHVRADWVCEPALDAAGGWVRSVLVVGVAGDTATIMLRLALTPLREADPDPDGTEEEEGEDDDDAAAAGAWCWRVDVLRRVADDA